MSTIELKEVERVSATGCAELSSFGRCVVCHIKKAARAVYRTISIDGDVFLESRDWPYLWKKN